MPLKLTGMYRRYFLVIYLVVIGYGLATYLVGEMIVLPTIIGVGLPIILYLTLDYLAPPLIACFAGYYARWSLPFSLFAGYPLVVLASLIFPVGNTEKSLPVPVPWLSAYKTASSQKAIMSSIADRLPWHTGLFILAVLVGLAHAMYLQSKASNVDQQPS